MNKAYDPKLNKHIENVRENTHLFWLKYLNNFFLKFIQLTLKIFLKNKLK